MSTLLKQCKLCPNVTEDARYVRAIDGWRCNKCDLLATGAFTVEALRQATPVDFNPVQDEGSFVVQTQEVLENALTQGLRTTLRRHKLHLSELS